MSSVGVGERPRTPVQKVVKFLWIGIWLAYLSAPVSDLLHGGHGVGVRGLGWVGLVAFVAWYFVLVFRTGRGEANGLVLGSLAVLVTQATVLSLSLGREWLVLFVYVSISSGAALPYAYARWSVPAASALLSAVALAVPGGTAYLASLLIPALLGGFSMTGVRQLIRTSIELRQARATVARLAANEERLRLARDLHDLLGHSLSLITLKSELAGRMLPAQPEKAAQQVADIERVSRQALVDVREAVAGYRRPRLVDELAGARVALTAAGVVARLPEDVVLDGVPEDSEAALAWALREAVTNVVRHSGASRCAVDLVRRQTLDGATLELSVEDNGVGDAGAAPGNGLTGLAERLEKTGGTLEATGTKHGFRLVARVPVGSAP
ncbi:sensor histidine kinase [Streptomyces roseirectus]|uniref:Sensor histidine kinase n=1 Tax=Streptomyces roseirectus TaxID=2768066 RepID=A0A7H0IC80_9ACTN|nr:sensor histidine kinase [Streptomyces roseirectus]QNP70396.1 sensor histidine kinase [Streptomyces roseirectus]